MRYHGAQENEGQIGPSAPQKNEMNKVYNQDAPVQDSFLSSLCVPKIKGDREHPQNQQNSQCVIARIKSGIKRLPPNPKCRDNTGHLKKCHKGIEQEP